MPVDVVPASRDKTKTGDPSNRGAYFNDMPLTLHLFHLNHHHHSLLLTDHEVDHQAHDVKVAQPKPLLGRIRHDLVRVVVSVVDVQSVAVHRSPHRAWLRRLPG